MVLIGSHTSSTVLVSTGELQGCAQPTHVHTVHQWLQHKTMGKTLQWSLQMTPPLKSPNKQPPQCVQQDNSRDQSGNKESRVSSVFWHMIQKSYKHSTRQPNSNTLRKNFPLRKKPWAEPGSYVDGPSGQRRRTRREGQKEERKRHIQYIMQIQELQKLEKIYDGLLRWHNNKLRS